MGDVACEDPRSGSIIVVISAARPPPLPGGPAAPTSLILGPARRQPRQRRKRARGERGARVRDPPAVCSFEARTGGGGGGARGRMSISLLSVQMFIRPASVDKRKLNAPERLFLTSPS